MDTKIKTTPKDFFLHLAMVVTLFVSVITFIMLISNFIDLAFPDLVRIGDFGIYQDSQVRVQLSILIIFFPAYLLTMWYLGKEYKIEPLKRLLTSRKWMIYFILFVAFMAMVVSLVIIMNSFLGGELFKAFTLKILTTMIVVGLVFLYYIKDLKKDKIPSQE